MLTLCFLAEDTDGGPGIRIYSRALDLEAQALLVQGLPCAPRDWDGVMDTAAVVLLALGHQRLYVVDHDTRIGVS